MALVNFGYRVDMNEIPAPIGTGAYIVAYDLDGVLKQKDSNGVITIIGGTGSGTGPVGPQGPTGPAGIGITGPTGPAGEGSDQDNYVMQININEYDLPNGYNEWDIMAYILNLPEEERTIGATVSKVNIIINYYPS